MEYTKLTPHIQKDDILWKYMDLHKFLSLLSSKSIFFNRVDLFDDPFEGVPFQSIVNKTIADGIDPSNLNPNFDDERKGEILAHKITETENYHNYTKAFQKTQYVSCWHIARKESMAMWNLYSNRDSIAIFANGWDLIDNITGNLDLRPDFHPNDRMLYGKVHYLPINPFDCFEDVPIPKYPAFMKDTSYAYENEYRFLFLNMESETLPYFKLDLTINFSKLISILVHPQMEEYKFQNIVKLCKMYNFNEPSKSKVILNRK